MDSQINLKPKVDIKNLSFFYGTSKALKDISLPLYDRKVTAFIGPSGCGKSTLLRAINRIFELYPNQRAEGEIVMDGENLLTVKDLNLLRARIGMVFQKPTPFPMSIYDNVAFGIKLYERIPRSEMDGRVDGNIGTLLKSHAAPQTCLRLGFSRGGPEPAGGVRRSLG